MNAINRFFLFLVLSPTSLYRKWGVNVSHLQAILHAKLTMDDRRTNAFLIAKQKTKKDKPPSKSTIITMLISFFMGLFFLYVFVFGKDFLTQLTIYFSMFMFMLASTLISDFTSVLIDVRDNFIILPKPVNDRTFVLARLLHIIVHVCKIILPMAIPGIITMIFLSGWGVLLFIILILLSTLFTIFLINAIYLLILRITTPDRFRNIISYIQIFFAIFIYAAFQLLPRLLGRIDALDFTIRQHEWLLAFPSYWFAAAFETMYNWQPLTQEWIGTFLSLVLPFVSIYIVIRHLAPAFNQKLSMISGSSDNQTDRKVVRRRSDLARTLARWFTSDRQEQTGFALTWAVSSRSRDFKVKTYPGIGYMVVIIAMMFVSRNSLQLRDLQTPEGRSTILMSLYFLSFVLLIAMANMIVSEKFKAAWIYYIAPLHSPGPVINGAMKAMIVKFFLPLAVISAAVVVALQGTSMLPNLLLALCNQVLLVYVMYMLSKRSLPFSMQMTTDQQAGNFVKALLRLMVLAAIGLVHYLLRNNIVLVYTMLALSITATYILMRQIRHTSWQQLKVAEE